MALSLPPGPRYLLRQLPSILVPPAVTYLLLQLLSTQLSLRLPSYLLVLAYTLSWPIAFTLLVQWRAWKNRRDAAARGAVIPPEVEHKLPGSVDLLVRMFRNDKTMYLGEFLPDCDPCGVLWVPSLCRNMARDEGAKN